MNPKPFEVIFTGQCVPGMDRLTVVSNLVLDVGVSEEKARALLKQQRVVLKRFALASDAQKMVAKLEQAGIICAVVNATAKQIESTAANESVLVSLLSKFSQLKKK